MSKDAVSGSEREFIAAVTKARGVRHISQAELARRMSEAGHGWHQTTVAKTEAGERRLLLSEAYALAAMFDVSLAAPTNPKRAELAEALSRQAEEIVRTIRAL